MSETNQGASDQTKQDKKEENLLKDDRKAEERHTKGLRVTAKRVSCVHVFC